MFFEGSEKKAEVIVSDNISLLNDVSDDFWAEMVSRCEAQILSHVSNGECTAFLLSESSLFVWEDRILILTCGVTRLVKSVEYFIQQFGMDNIQHVFYQRKNEYFAQAQFSSFGDDISLLSDYMPGKAYRFGELDGHHNYVFHQTSDYKAENEDKTYELLAYQISDKASSMLTLPGLRAEQIRNYLQLEQLLPGFEFDDYVFDPYGYSVNAIKGSDYFTIHITPQAGISYVSFESNLNLIRLAPSILTVLEPASFDLLTFNEPDLQQLITQYIPQHYVCQSKVAETMSNGYQLSFVNYIAPKQQFTKPAVLDATGENHAL
ncbi:adenosylmethionine decarboxylase [Thalassotalea sp. Y01]|uniref:adenosylmethionine decarboxylase n=1 Tax=Thalassotalea sp. Y01 TaxID=2729613 RepID=UPI00145DC452|nr:adenosylmethionine decarboxylase [Thalassotalea sp. Y01]NMP17739.1 adenosylmethionine decarboxylase [Thalassotalea sp. Y01]